MTFETSVRLFMNQFSGYGAGERFQDLIKDISQAKRIAYFVTRRYQDRPMVLRELLDIVVISGNSPGKESMIFIEPGLRGLSERVRKYISQNLRVNSFVDWPNTRAYIIDIETKKEGFEPDIAIFDGEETLEALYLDQNPPVLDELISRGTKIWVCLEKGPDEALNGKSSLPSTFRRVRAFSRTAISSHRLDWAKNLELEGRKVEDLFLVLRKKEKSSRREKPKSSGGKENEENSISSEEREDMGGI